MGNTLLIIVGIFMVAMTAIGLKRGMLKMAFSLISVVVVLLLVNILTPPTKQLLKATPIYTGIQNTIEEYVSNNIESSAQSVTQTGVGAQKKIIEKLPLPKEIKATLNAVSYTHLDVYKRQVLNVMMIAFIISAIFSIIGVSIGKMSLKTNIPFVPFIFCGNILFYLCKARCV